jgi:hypothetical protein
MVGYYNLKLKSKVKNLDPFDSSKKSKDFLRRSFCLTMAMQHGLAYTQIIFFEILFFKMELRYL